MTVIPLVPLPEGIETNMAEEQFESFQKLEEVEIEDETAEYLISLNYARKA